MLGSAATLDPPVGFLFLFVFFPLFPQRKSVSQSGPVCVCPSACVYVLGKAAGCNATQRNRPNALNSLLVSLVPLTGNTDKKEINKSIKTLKINLKIVRFLLFIYFIWDLAMNAHSAADGH